MNKSKYIQNQYYYSSSKNMFFYIVKIINSEILDNLIKHQLLIYYCDLKFEKKEVKPIDTEHSKDYYINNVFDLIPNKHT